MSVLQTRLAIVAFVAFISVPLLAHIAGISPGNVDNRGLADRPAIEAGSILDDDYYGEWTSFLNDNFPFRDLATRANLRIDQTLFDSSSIEVVRGDDGWLYLRRSFDRLCEAVLTPTEASVIWIDAMAEMRASGAEVTLTVVPDKFDVYPQNLGDAAEDAECAFEASREVEAAMTGQEGFVPLWDALRTDDEDDPTFFRKDTHWTDAGAMVAFEALLGDRFDPAEVTTLPTVERTGDLTRLAGFPSTEPAVPLEIDRPGVEVTETANPDSEGARVYRYEATSTGAELLPGQTLVVHDSFFEPNSNPNLREGFAQYSEETVFVHWDSGNTVDLMALAAESDRVVLQVVQRLFSTRGFEVLASE